MDDREFRLMTLLFLAAWAVSVAAWSWVLHEAFGWLAVGAIAVCGHLWVWVFSPHRPERHVVAMFQWGMVAVILWLMESPFWLAIMLALPVGMQTALLVLWVAFEVPHRWRRRHSRQTTVEGDPNT